MAERQSAVVALFASGEALLEAIPKVRARAPGRLEAYTPYPVHGLTEALGIERSRLGVAVFAMGLSGAVLALLFQWWTSAVDYPVVVGGKPLFSWQAFVPIMFELMVLFAAFTSGLGMLLIFNRLPWFGHPILRSRAIAATTRDHFALSIESVAGEPFDMEAAQTALREAGGRSIEVLTADTLAAGGEESLPLKPVLGIVVAAIVAGVFTYHGVKWFPLLPPMNAMEVQSRAVAFRESDFFPDGRSMRPSAPGSVARGALEIIPEDPVLSGRLLANPLPRSEAVFERGRARYETFCQVCHGPLGTGEPSLSDAYTAKPANLQSSSIRDYPDGQIFHVISWGKNTMPGYAADMAPDDRWAVVHYVRALQRSQNASAEDMP